MLTKKDLDLIAYAIAMANGHPDPVGYAEAAASIVFPDEPVEDPVPAKKTAK